MEHAQQIHATDHQQMPLDRDDFEDTQEHGQAQNEQTPTAIKPEKDKDAEWPDFSNDDPDEFFSCDDFDDDFSLDATTEDFNPDMVLSAGWQAEDNSNQPAWRELERRREQMALERALHDELYDF